MVPAMGHPSAVRANYKTAIAAKTIATISA
jgi:hypothetical protein